MRKLLRLFVLFLVVFFAGRCRLLLALTVILSVRVSGFRTVLEGSGAFELQLVRRCCRSD